ncbi:MAG: phosphotransferase [Alcanivoracaceae bacterium]|nr:phosphotransferase [Alcanivoracaceae bacterium]
MQPATETGQIGTKTGQDERKSALDEWVSAQIGRPLSGQPASADASFRRYFRYKFVDGDVERSLIGMDAPPPQEDCRPFVRIAGLFADAGVHVPHILAQDLHRGFLLLPDMGTETWLTVLNDDNAEQRFSRAIDALIRIQRVSQPNVLPVYDEALLRRELELFPEWYLKRHLGIDIDAGLRAELDAVFDQLVARALSQGQVYVHRDYMPRNLMDSDPDPGIIDFQDAVYGPVSYDVTSLFKDAFISWPEQRVLGWLQLYWQRARSAELPVPASFEQFLQDCDLMGAQRHLKVIGIFARICHRDGKPKYLQDVPRFAAYLRTVIRRREQLAPLGALMDRVGL